MGTTVNQEGQMGDFDMDRASTGASYPQSYAGGEKMLSMPTMKDRLTMAVKQAEEKLASAKRARELFDKNPDLEELLNILQRSNF